MRRAAVPGPALVVACALLVGCGGARGGDAAGLPGERRAALAHLVVDNRTDLPLEIVVRYAVGPGGEITVGTAPAGEVRQMAPIPASEPIVLTARGRDFEQVLPPRSFHMGEVWRWVVRGDDEREP